jgi:hypothetical protein
MIELTDEMVAAFRDVWMRSMQTDPSTDDPETVADRAGLAAVLALAERQWQGQYGDAFQAGWWRGQHDLCPRCGVELEREVRGEQPDPARKGYETAIAVLRGVADRTGSPAANWCADYLLADPDRLAPPPQ